MKIGLLARRRNVSSALVITLLGIVLLTIMVVAFMQTMSMSLNTAKSYADIRRASLAAQAGLDTAIAQITMAVGTNLAFVTGQTNYPSVDFPLTVIGEGNLTNLDQMMPLVSGPVDYLSNFGAPGFAANFDAYSAPRADVNALSNVDVNTPYQFIQATNAAFNDANTYRASWVMMTNQVGALTNYTRYAYVVLDDSARVNPALMTGMGVGATNGFANPTNWYSGPQDISLTNSSAPLLNSSQMSQVQTATNSFVYSDATLGETFPARADYEAVKHLFTSQTNASFDVIPAWMPDGGKPKYNINDLATNTAYGSSTARVANIANIIMKNLPNFYMRDPAFAADNKTLYVNRLAANIVSYINPEGTFTTGDYSTNFPSITPLGTGVFPITMSEQIYAKQGGHGTAAHTSAVIVCQFWLNCWNPNTTPVTIKSASLLVWNRPAYTLGNGPPVSIGAYGLPPYDHVAIISDSEGTGTSDIVVGPNEFVVLGFPAITEPIITGTSTTDGPVSVAQTPPSLEQYALTVNGQIVARSQNMGDGFERTSQQITESPTNTWNINFFSNWGTGVADPRFLSYYATVWNQQDGNYSDVAFKGRPNNGNDGQNIGARNWEPYYSWINRDNMARNNSTPGGGPSPATILPSAVKSVYNPSTDSNAAPEVMRNAPMVSIGELGHIADPAQAGEDLTTSNICLPTIGYDSSGCTPSYFYSPYQNGGARSLRIGRPESTGAMTSTGSPTSASWDKDGERAIDLLDLFTVNNMNSAGGVGAVNYTNLVTGGAMGRINPNTASTNVLAAVFSGIKITSDPDMGTVGLANLAALAQQVVNNRPYSCLSDLYKNLPIFDAYTNYAPQLSVNGAGYLNVANRVHQEAFGKWIQHLTVQSRAYRIYVIGQVLDSARNPHGSVAMEAGVYLQYDETALPPKYQPVVQYVRLLR